MGVGLVLTVPLPQTCNSSTPAPRPRTAEPPIKSGVVSFVLASSSGVSSTGSGQWSKDIPQLWISRVLLTLHRLMCPQPEAGMGAATQTPEAFDASREPSPDVSTQPWGEYFSASQPKSRLEEPVGTADPPWKLGVGWGRSDGEPLPRDPPCPPWAVSSLLDGPGVAEGWPRSSGCPCLCWGLGWRLAWSAVFPCAL